MTLLVPVHRNRGILTSLIIFSCHAFRRIILTLILAGYWKHEPKTSDSRRTHVLSGSVTPTEYSDIVTINSTLSLLLTSPRGNMKAKTWQYKNLIVGQVIMIKSSLPVSLQFSMSLSHCLHCRPIQHLQ